jgi:glycosyltransferase involved in cell wall biosynthesis
MSAAPGRQIAMLLTNPFRPDTRVLKEARSLVEHGYRVNVIAWDRQGEYPAVDEIIPGLTVQRVQDVPSGYGIGARQILPLRRFWHAAGEQMNEYPPNLVHCHDFDTLLAGLSWGRRRGIPVIYDAHEHYAELVTPRLKGPARRLLPGLIRRVERYAARRATAIITVDETLGSYYRSLNRRVLVLGHYPSRRLVDVPVQVFTRPELNLLYHGRLSQDRGLESYLEILRLLRRAGVPADLHIAGAFTPKSDYELLLHFEPVLQQYIHQHNWVPYDHLPGLLTGADCGLALLQPLPRFLDALPVKMFEYMAAGLPVLASDFPAIRQVVEEAHCGALLAPDQPQQAAALLQSWWENPRVPQSLGRNGYQSVQERYNWETLGDRLVALYQTLI